MLTCVAGIMSMRDVHHVVLDEADTLLDDSFNEKLCHFLKRFPVGNRSRIKQNRYIFLLLKVYFIFSCNFLSKI